MTHNWNVSVWLTEHLYSWRQGELSFFVDFWKLPWKHDKKSCGDCFAKKPLGSMQRRVRWGGGGHSLTFMYPLTNPCNQSSFRSFQQYTTEFALFTNSSFGPKQNLEGEGPFSSWEKVHRVSEKEVSSFLPSVSKTKEIKWSPLKTDQLFPLNSFGF